MTTTTATTYNVAGHVCPTTGRLAMTVAEAWAREDSPDRHFSLYNIEAAGMGLDPWRLIEGMDMSTGAPAIYTLDFAAGRSINVQGSTIVYMQRTKAERAEAVTQSPTAADALAMAVHAVALRAWVVDLESVNGMKASISGLPGAWKSEHVEQFAPGMMSSPLEWRVTGIDRERA